MSSNIWAEDNNDYRHFKQPLELKNIEDLNEMTEKEKEMYAEKLQIEIFEHKNREETYIQRRTELLEIENAYRFVLSKNQEKLDG